MSITAKGILSTALDRVGIPLASRLGFSAYDDSYVASFGLPNGERIALSHDDCQLVEGAMLGELVRQLRARKLGHR
jgi:hypothetical protein